MEGQSSLRNKRSLMPYEHPALTENFYLKLHHGSSGYLGDCCNLQIISMKAWC